MGLFSKKAIESKKPKEKTPLQLRIEKQKQRKLRNQ